MKSLMILIVLLTAGAFIVFSVIERRPREESMAAEPRDIGHAARRVFNDSKNALKETVEAINNAVY